MTWPYMQNDVLSHHKNKILILAFITFKCTYQQADYPTHAILKSLNLDEAILKKIQGGSSVVIRARPSQGQTDGGLERRICFCCPQFLRTFPGEFCGHNPVIASLYKIQKLNLP